MSESTHRIVRFQPKRNLSPKNQSRRPIGNSMIVNILYCMKIGGLNQELILDQFNIRKVSQYKLGVGEAIGEEL